MTSLSIVSSKSIHIITNGRISLFLLLNNIPLCVYMHTCVHTYTHTTVSLPFTCQWTLKLSPCLGHCEYCCSEYGGTAIFQDSNFISFRYIQRSGMAGLYGSSSSSFLRNLHTVFQSGCTNLHFHRQCTKIPFSLHLCQHLL